MGVPTFFRWLTEKYPKTLNFCIEEYPQVIDTVIVPIDATKPNPNEIEFDNLYLDLNGIVHPCCHPESGEAPATEELMVEAVFEYLDRIFSIIRPRKLVYMALDGVAPRAKMNQQRSRRFRAAKERHEKETLKQELRQEFEKEFGDNFNFDAIETKKEWDHNVITPGTLFMDKLSRGIQYYIHERLNTDLAWKGVKVIFSDANVPGEGEHKIMEFIREQRAQPGYNANTRHVLCGLDADLIMLGLASHEPYFTIFREWVQMGGRRGGNKDDETPKEAEARTTEALVDMYKQKPFQFLHLNILREYLQNEFSFEGVDFSKLGFELDFERIIDDFVFMCFFVGNDFLPHLPSLDIREGALEKLIDMYKVELLKMGGYITNGGEVNLERVEVLLTQLGYVEDGVFIARKQKEDMMKQRNARRKADDEYRKTLMQDEANNFVALGKRAREEVDNKRAAQELKKSMFSNKENSEEGDAPPSKKRKTEEGYVANDAGTDLQTSVQDLNDTQPSSEQAAAVDIAAENKKTAKDFITRLKTRIDDNGKVDEAKHPDNVLLGEHGWKDRYYDKKFHISTSDSQFHQFRSQLCKSYLEGLVWVMKYYYEGCASWSWYYPYHYAPFASDMVGLKNIDIRFEKSSPIKPFNQLMSVLPADSGHCLPPAYRDLMSNPNSPIIQFFPKNFAIDLNGKRFAWQGVALLPFLDIEKLIATVTPLESTLTDEEAKRNSLNSTEIYVYSRTHLAITRAIVTTLETDARNPLDYPTHDIAGYICASERNEISKDVDDMDKNDQTEENKEEYFSIAKFTQESVHPPFNDSGRLQTISNNLVIFSRFDLPPHTKHNTHLLPGLTPPPAQLTERDFMSKNPYRTQRYEKRDYYNPDDYQNMAGNRLIRNHLPRDNYGGDHRNYNNDRYGGYGNRDSSRDRYNSRDNRDRNYGGGRDYNRDNDMRGDRNYGNNSYNNNNYNRGGGSSHSSYGGNQNYRNDYNRNPPVYQNAMPYSGQQYHPQQQQQQRYSGFSGGNGGGGYNTTPQQQVAPQQQQALYGSNNPAVTTMVGQQWPQQPYHLNAHPNAFPQQMSAPNHGAVYPQQASPQQYPQQYQAQHQQQHPQHYQQHQQHQQHQQQTYSRSSRDPRNRN